MKAETGFIRPKNELFGYREIVAHRSGDDPSLAKPTERIGRTSTSRFSGTTCAPYGILASFHFSRNLQHTTTYILGGNSLPNEMLDDAYRECYIGINRFMSTLLPRLRSLTDLTLRRYPQSKVANVALADSC
jgi:hypothetical protein